MDTPVSIEVHKTDYQNNAWQQYTIAELGQWVHLLVKRAAHRSNLEKAKKDLYDAQNYLNMIQAHIDAVVR